MKKYISIIFIMFLCLVLYGCEESTKVTFNYNCPGTSVYKCSVLDKKINCTFTMPTCGDKEFIGWYDKPVNGTRVNLDKDFTESTTLYAYWNDKSPVAPDPEPEPDIETYYNLVFNANGGLGGQNKNYQIESGSQLPEISKEKPVKDGYTFMGWYDNSDYTKGIQYYDENCNRLLLFDKESDLILYAGWKKNSTIIVPDPEPEPIDEEYMITFNSNGGSGGQSGYEYATYGKAMPTIDKTKPTRTGYEFMGWYDNSDYTKGTRYYDSNCSSVRTYNKKSGITLYAGWNIKMYTITFNLNGGSNGQTGTLSTTYNEVLPSISKSIPSRSGYTFKGWYDNSDYTKGTQYYNEKNEAVRVFNKTSNITLYAGWSKIVTVFKYTVKFNINNGTGTTPSDVTAILGNAMPAITTSVPTKSGYTFMGWYDNANYLNGTQYYTAQNKSARAYDRMSGITLYAGWKGNNITIKYDCNGGTGAPANQTVTYGDNVTLNANTCKNGDMAFDGWVDPTNAKWKNKWSGTWKYLNGQNGITNNTLVLKATWTYPVRVATYNIGYFGCGTSKKVKCHATLAQITEMFKKYQIDMAGIQEAVPANDVIKLGKNVGMNYYYKTQPANINMILSKYEIKSKKTTTLVSCNERRSLDKAVVNINGVDISFYNTHYSYQSGCPAKQMEHAASIIKNDPNPVILTGDTNTSKITNYETYLKPIGFEIAAYDGVTHGYCDSVFIIPKGHIDVISAKTEVVYGIYSDHNFVVATLSIH